jgi:hypothetical protein
VNLKHEAAFGECIEVATDRHVGHAELAHERAHMDAADPSYPVMNRSLALPREQSSALHAASHHSKAT